jgi:glutathione S-transferase
VTRRLAKGRARRVQGPGTGNALFVNMELSKHLNRLRFWRDSRRAHRDLELARSEVTSLLRAGAGSGVTKLGPRPEKRLVLYELETCPDSRRVREALSMLDIDVDIRPCPSGAEVHRRELESIGGKPEIPALLDPNTMAVVHGADPIIEYLFVCYGAGKPPLSLRLGPLAAATSRLASAMRGKTPSLRAADRPEQPLELWSYEASPESRLVRETLSAYGLPYVLYNAARGSPKRRRLAALSNGRGVPLLIDPNRDVVMHGATNIRAYLRETYARPAIAEPVTPDPIRGDRASVH